MGIVNTTNGGTGGARGTGGNRGTAFTKQRTSQNGNGRATASEGNRDQRIGGSNGNPLNANDASVGVNQPIASNANGSGQSQDGSARPSGIVETDRERKNRLRRERYAQQNGRAADTGQEGNPSRIQTDSIEDENTAAPSFEVSVEAGIVTSDKAVQKPKQTKARPQAPKKYKEPTKDKVDMVASGFRDVYSVLDAFIGAGVRMTGREYPDGLFDLNEEKSEKLARAMVQLNNALPALAERINKVSAPLTLASVFVSDLAFKGAVLYAIFKDKPTPNVSP